MFPSEAPEARFETSVFGCRVLLKNLTFELYMYIVLDYLFPSTAPRRKMRILSCIGDSVLVFGLLLKM